MKPIRVLAAAYKDIQNACDYYNHAQSGLGQRFASAVTRTFRDLSSNPEAMQDLGSGIRRWQVKNFPHGVMYSVIKSEIIIISVFHPAQDPERLLDRL